jgi:pyridoxal phosphate enzyme (YggS family)
LIARVPELPEGIKIVAASKQQSIEKIRQVLREGITALGENFVQEAIPKIEALKGESIEWHFIGQVQSNKTRLIAQYFDWVQSVEKESIAKRLNDQRPSTCSPLNICIEINDSKEASKAGIALCDLPDFIDKVRGLPRLRWRGLMTTVTEDYEKTAKAFFALKEKGYDIDTLSMGMSSDYVQAIKYGATMVRLGTLIFGKRSYHD